LADCISITFELQKRYSKNDIFTQHHSRDPILCPVQVWASFVHRVLSYPAATKETTVNTFRLKNNKLHLFTAKDLLYNLRLATTSIGADTLGFTVLTK
jgi:hypothetical protein